MAKNQIEYKVVIDVDGTAKIEQLAKTTKDIPAVPKEVGNSFTKLQANIVTAYSALQAYDLIARKVINAVTGLVTPFLELEKSVAQINTIVTEAEKRQINFGKAITDNQKNFGASQADVAKAYYDAIGSGAVKASEATLFFDTANKLAIGGVTSLKNATDVLTSVMSAYGFEASQTGAISDILFIAARDGKTDIDQLSGSIGQALSIAKQMGVGFDELSASVSAVTLAGVSTSEATTSVRAAMVALTKPTEELQALYKDLGISSIQAEIGQSGLVGTLKKLTAASGGSSEGLVQLFGRVEALSAVTALTSDVIGQKFTSMYQAMQDGANNAGSVTTKAFEQMQQTSSFQVDLLKQRAQVALISLGTIFSGVGNNILASLNSFMSGVISVFDSISNVIKNVDFQILIDGFYELQTAALIAAGAIAGWLAMTKGIDAVAAVNAIKNMVAALYLQAKATWAVVAPTVILAAKILLIGGAIATVVVAIDLIARNLTNLGDVFIAIGAKIAEWVNSVAAMLSRLIAKISFFNKKWSALAEGYEDTAKDMSKTSADAAKNVDWGGAGKILEFAQKAFGGTTDAVQKTESATKSLQKTVAAAPTMPAPDPNTLKQYDALVEKIKSMELAVAKNQMTDQQYVDFAKQKALEEVTLVEQKLQAEHRYTSERKANLDKLKGLIKAQADEEKKAADVKFAAKVLDDQKKIADIMGNSVESNRIAMEQQSNNLKESLDKGTIDVMQYHSAVKQLEKNHQDYMLNMQLDNQKKIADIMGNSVESNRIAMEQQSNNLKAMLDSNKIDMMQYHEAVEQLEKNHQDYVLNLNGETATKLDAIMGTQTNTMLESFRKKRDEIEKLAAKPIDAGGITQKQKGAALKQIDQQQAFAAPVAGVTDALAPAANLANSISGMVGGIANAAGGIVTAIAKIPQIFDGLIDMVDSMMESWLDFPTKIFDKFMASQQKLMEFPQKFLTNLGNALPKISGFLTKTLATTAPMLISSLLKGIPKLVMGLIEAIPAVFNAIIDGIIEGALALVDGFRAFFDPNNWKVGEGLAESGKSAVDAVGKSVTGVGSKLFGFVEQSGASQAQQQQKNILDASKKGTNWFQKVWDIIKKGFLTYIGLWKTAFETIIKLIKNVFDFIFNQFEITWNLIKVIFDVIIDNFKALWQLAKSTFTFIVSLLKGSWEFIKTVFSIVIDNFKALWDLTKSTFMIIVDLFLAAWEFAKVIFTVIIDNFSAMWELVKSIFGVIVDTFKWLFVDVIWGLVLKPFVDLVKWVFVDIVWGLVLKPAVDLFMAMWNFVTTLFDNPVQAFKDLWESIKNIFAGIIDNLFSAFTKLGEIFAGAWESLKTAFANALNIFKDFFAALGTYFTKAFEGIVKFFEGLGTYIMAGFDGVIKFFKGLLTYVDSAFDNVVKFFKGIGTWVESGFASVMDFFKGIGTYISSAFDGVTKLFTGLKTYVSDAFSGVINFFSNIGSTIWEGISSAWGSVKNFFASIFTIEPSAGKVESWLGFDFPWVNFAEGGMVGGKAQVQGDSLKNDTVPALLSAGEYVLPRSVTQNKDLMQLILALVNSNKKVEKHGFGDFVGKAWQGAKDLGSAAVNTVTSAASTVWEGAKSAGRAVVDGAKWVGDLLVPDAIQELYDSVTRFIPSVDLAALVAHPIDYMTNLLKTMVDTFKPYFQQMVKPVGFANGGLVGSTDTVPAMLTAGEFVMSKPAVQQYGLGALNALNQGNAATGTVTNNNIELTLNIKTEQPIDEKFVKNVIMPTVQNELRRLSLDGRRVLANSGVR
jgi:TP901 family phage tail tape measure protein